METWKPIAFTGGKYEVSDLGRVRNAERGELHRPWLRSGYPTVNLRLDGKRHFRAVHVLVLEAFAGARPKGHHAAHLDGNRANVVLSNLSWVTQSENEAHKIAHGSHSNGAAARRRKFTDRQVEIIRELAAEGVPQTRLAELLGVPDSTVSLIIKRRSYA
jgi:hypothetical protein